MDYDMYKIFLRNGEMKTLNELSDILLDMYLLMGIIYFIKGFKTTMCDF